MAIVMGLGQHHAQIAAEWIDTDTGELARARVSPAHRGDVRTFLKRFAGQPRRAQPAHRSRERVRRQEEHRDRAALANRLGTPSTTITKDERSTGTPAAVTAHATCSVYLGSTTSG